MAKNRDYTGLVRTPSSMAWLIRERARIQGKIERLEKLASQLPLEIKALSEQLKSIDAVFPLHEVKVEPTAIKGRNPVRPRILPHGALTRSIFDCLRESADRGPSFTTEIAFYVARTHNLDINAIGRVELVQRVSYRLKALAKEGHVVRHHDTSFPGNQEEGRWSLSLETD